MRVKLATGYGNPAYAESLAEFGRPRALPRSGGWILEREIPGRELRDAMGCYPLFACRDWSKLDGDLRGVSHELVSVVVVTDPFGDYTETTLRQTFQDLVTPFKKHFVADLQIPREKFVHPHHQRNVRKALREVAVEWSENPHDYRDEWNKLYASLVERHEIKGMAKFSPRSFTKQLLVPGLTLFRGTYRGKNVGMTLWYTDGDVGYYHLGAYSKEGYELLVSFALFWRALGEFSRRGVRWLNLGAGAGLTDTVDDGLNRFKRGWSTSTRTAYLCGKIFDHERYDEITEGKGIRDTSYFPAYRAGELI